MFNMETRYLSNVEVFLNFLADNFALTKYIVAYTKRYDICVNPFYRRVKAKADKAPKNLFTDLLGSGHKFKDLEEKWKKYVDITINYEPQAGDIVECFDYDEKDVTKREWRTTFKEGTKECFFDMNGKVNDRQIFVRKYIED